MRDQYGYACSLPPSLCTCAVLLVLGGVPRPKYAARRVGVNGNSCERYNSTLRLHSCSPCEALRCVQSFQTLVLIPVDSAACCLALFHAAWVSTVGV